MIGFDAIVGHDREISILKRALAAGRVAHAYLFEGVEGCGKKTTALALVQALFCGGSEACGACPSCRKVASLQHADLHLLEPDGTQIKIDQVRELQKGLSYRPMEAPRKACIINHADRLNPSSGNALLKTLEEPPGNALIILVTANPTAVLPTILSRCQRLEFSPVPQDAIEKLLVAQGIEEAIAAWSAAAAGGSVSTAIAAAGEESSAERETLLRGVIPLSTREISPLFEAAERFGGDREKALRTVLLLRDFYRDLLLASHGSDPGAEERVASFAGEFASVSTMFLLDSLEMLRRAEEALLRNANPRLTLENVFMALERPL